MKKKISNLVSTIFMLLMSAAGTYVGLCAGAALWYLKIDPWFEDILGK